MRHLSSSWILVAHADPQVRQGILDALTPLGLRLAAVADGAGALEALGTGPPAAAVLEAELPGVSGTALCEQLRHHRASAQVPVLRVAARLMPEAGAEALQAGASDVIFAPFHPLVVARRVSAWLQLAETRAQLLQSRKALRGLQRVAAVATWEVDAVTGAFEGTEEIRSLFGFRPEEKTSLELLLSRIPPAERQVIRSFFHMSRASGEGFDIETHVELPDGRPRVLQWRAEVANGPRGEPQWIVGSIQDVTERAQTEQQIRHLAYHDGLTGLTNRNAFMDRLREALAAGRRHGRSVGLLFLDLDHFKRINDTLGHSVGDRLLQVVARRLEACLRQTDAIARAVGPIGGVSRLGGDEFTVLLSEVASAEDAGGVARRILEALRERIVIDRHEVGVGVSIGITLFPGDGEDVDSLLRNADIAMYDAKARGRSNFQFFCRSMSEGEARRSAIEGGVGRALEDGHLEIHYQPQVDLGSSQVVGAEALLRWRDPGLGEVSPAEFVAVAEEGGLIHRLGAWALQEACQQAVRWLDDGLPALELGVNISPRQFEGEELLDLVGQTLFDTGLPGSRLVLEVTETVFSRDPEAAARLLRELKRLDVRIALDDFGTGYSSLSYLKRFPVDAVKIDRSFVSDAIVDPDDATITRAIISMAEALGLGVIAEGVETREQCGFLARHGCTRMQGHLFSAALPAAELARSLRSGGLEALLEAVRQDA